MKLLSGAPVVPALDPVRMIEPPEAHQRQRLLNREDRALHVGIEGFVNVLGGDLAERKRASRTRIGKNDVEGSRSAFTAA